MIHTIEKTLFFIFQALGDKEKYFEVTSTTDNILLCSIYWKCTNLLIYSMLIVLSRSPFLTVPVNSNGKTQSATKKKELFSPI